MKEGDLVYPWHRIDSAIGLVIKTICDQWSDRTLVLTEGELLEIPTNQIEAVDEGG